MHNDGKYSTGCQEQSSLHTALSNIDLSSEELAALLCSLRLIHRALPPSYPNWVLPMARPSSTKQELAALQMIQDHKVTPRSHPRSQGGETGRRKHSTS